ncbi:MAG: uroporphyrinogen decarboxylase family protein [Anaerolineales bacterium]|nr:uroporphyrinogen decarboxylase family protein [Arenicellales bacterium]MDP7644819.1 uroporphyrinogen decarboxylase family protein [Anaerolineales bacterium]
MNTVERHMAAFQLGVPDRVPVSSWLGIRFLRTFFPKELNMLDLFDLWLDDPLNSIIRVQEELGLDPLFFTMSEHKGEVQEWPDRLIQWKPEAFENWREEKIEIDRDTNHRVVEHRVSTPAGEGSWQYHIEDYSDWPLQHLLDDEEKIDMLHYMPDPAHMDTNVMRELVGKVGDRAFFNHHIPGPWDEAAQLRGITDLAMDVYDRPDFVHRLMRILADRQVKIVRRLGEIHGLHSISLNETWVGVGLSPSTYNEFVKPYDAEVVKAIQDTGMLVSYHNCGRGTLILEDIVDTGADALETITSSESSGDFDLDDVKRRVGDRICLFGGFNERVLSSENPDDVRDEVKRCLTAAAEGGGYILRSMGQIFDAKPGNIEVMTATAHEHGCY